MKTQVTMTGEGPQPVGYIDGYIMRSSRVKDVENIYAIVVWDDKITAMPIQALKPYYDKSNTGPR